MCLPIIIFHSNFSQDFFLAPEIFFVGVITLLVCATLVPSVMHLAQRIQPWMSVSTLCLLGLLGVTAMTGSLTSFVLPGGGGHAVMDNRRGGVPPVTMKMATGPSNGWSWPWGTLSDLDEEWVTWGERSFFKLLKGGFFLGATQQKSFWGEFWGGFWGSHFFSPKSGFWIFIESGRPLTCCHGCFGWLLKQLPDEIFFQ